MTIMNEEKVIPSNYAVLSINDLYALYVFSSPMTKLNMYYSRDQNTLRIRSSRATSYSLSSSDPRV